MSHARAAGLTVGAYHYFRPLDDPKLQAQKFIEAVTAFMPAILVLDLEPTETTAHPVEDWDQLTVANRQAAVTAFLAEVQKAVLGPIVVYTTKFFWDDFMGSADFTKFKLFLASYRAAMGPLPERWKNWSFWQVRPDGVIPGVTGEVDVDFFNGEMSDLQALVCSANC